MTAIRRANGIEIPEDVQKWYQSLSRDDQQSAVAKLYELMHPPEYRLRVKPGPQMVMIIANIVTFAERHGIAVTAVKGRGDCPVFKFQSAADRNSVLLGIGIEKCRKEEERNESVCTL